MEHPLHYFTKREAEQVVEGFQLRVGFVWKKSLSESGLLESVFIAPCGYNIKVEGHSEQGFNVTCWFKNGPGITAAEFSMYNELEWTRAVHEVEEGA